MEKLLTNKYRPKCMDDLIFDDDFTNLLRNITKTETLNIIISGHIACGKTSIINILING